MVKLIPGASIGLFIYILINSAIEFDDVTNEYKSHIKIITYIGMMLVSILGEIIRTFIYWWIFNFFGLNFFIYWIVLIFGIGITVWYIDRVRKYEQ